jgi:hypothetical protein
MIAQRFDVHLHHTDQIHLQRWGGRETPRSQGSPCHLGYDSLRNYAVVDGVSVDEEVRVDAGVVVVHQGARRVLG